MKLLFLVASGLGHVNPTLPVVRELTRRAVRISYFVGTDFRRHVVHAGAKHCAVEEVSAVPRGPEPASRPLMRIRGLTEELRRVPQLVAAAARENADGVVYDPATGWGSTVAMILGTARARFLTTFALTPASPLLRASTNVPTSRSDELARALDALQSVTDDIRGRFGVKPPEPDAIFTDAEKLQIVTVLRSFQPEGECFDSRFVFVGPSVGKRMEPRTLDGSLLNPLSTVYASLGSTGIDDNEFVETCVEAFWSGGWHVVISGAATAPRGAPPSVFVRRTVPQLAVLARTRVFVTHGGMSSAMEALYFGVPMVVVPKTPEQRLVAAQIERLGAGLALDRGSLTAAVLREAAETLMTDPRYRAALARLRRSIETAGGYRRAADTLCDFFSASHRR